MTEPKNVYRVVERSGGLGEERPRRRLSSVMLLGLSALLIAITLVSVSALRGSLRDAGFGWLAAPVATIGVGCSILVSALGVMRAVTLPLSRMPAAIRSLSVFERVVIVLAHVGCVGLGALLTLFATVEFTRGRQVRRRGRVLLPPLGARSDWMPPGELSDRPALRSSTARQHERDVDVPAGVARAWRENGRTEHASVAAFARLSLDLVALGAPPELIAAAHEDALDEIRHAELCFGLACAIDGASDGPVAFPDVARARRLPRSRRLALAVLAVDSLVDGAVNEGASARMAARLAQRCQHDAIRAVLRPIAADEARHAAHGWDVTAWCLREGGWPVASALAGAVRVLSRRARLDAESPAPAGDWEPWGIAGASLMRAELEQTRNRACERARRLLAEASERRAA